VVEKKILYFKIEIAKLINHFLYLVIRSICDYLDLYKNKNWQKYIAIIAAVYTKDLLYRFFFFKIKVKKKISNILFFNWFV